MRSPMTLPLLTIRPAGLAAVLAASFVLLPGAVRAQEPVRVTEADAPRQVVSASPILWIAKWFNGDYERRLTPATTWGLSGSYLGIDDFHYGRASVLLRYYPQGRALNGFYLGGQSGLYRLASTSEHELLYGAGFDLGYAWLLGPRKQVGVSLGFGLSRAFGSGVDGASMVIPNARLVNVGVAF